MKHWIAAFLCFAFTVLAFTLPGATGDKPRVSRETLRAAEKSLDGRFSRMLPDNPLGLISTTRGLYLEGYGAVFTAEMNLVPVPISPMMGAMNKPAIEQHQKQKAERILQLKGVLREALVASATSLDTVPPEQMIVISAFLDRYSWEEAASAPTVITMQAPKKKLLDTQHAPGANLDSVISVTTEY